MPGKKKKFIDKKNAVTFHLVHRSQKDPLQASDDASKHVLTEAKHEDKESKKEEMKKYGVFFEDEYDYMQHLKEANEAFELEADDHFQIKAAVPKLQLPSSVFASDVEKEVGLLNEAVPIRGPQPDWDPDIVEALDDDFNFDAPENQLDDDFMSKANLAHLEGDTEEQCGLSDEDIASDEADMSGEDSDGGSDRGFFGDERFMQEETKSQFTNYSMSSSVMRRNKGLTLLDDRFEKLMEEYDQTEIGALDHEDIDGCIQEGNQVLTSALQEFESLRKEKKLMEVVDENVNEDVGVEVDQGSDEELINVFVEEPTEKWDCESILSTYSTLYNHPRLIEEPRKVNKGYGNHGNSEMSPAEPGLTRKELEEEMRKSLKADRVSTYRPQGETTEERACRKKAIKLERQNRRIEKKINKQAFKAEDSRQRKEQLNLKNNLQGLKITDICTTDDSGISALDGSGVNALDDSGIIALDDSGINALDDSGI
ncbi:hypothetical protein ScPMuIL_000280 [Solemya velum]